MNLECNRGGSGAAGRVFDVLPVKAEGVRIIKNPFF